MKVVKLLDQASEDGPHHDAGEVFDGDDTTPDEIATSLRALAPLEHLDHLEILFREAPVALPVALP